MTDDRAPQLPYDAWKAEVDRLCSYHLYCSWADLCGDEAPLCIAYEEGLPPIEFVKEWREQYELDWRDSPLPKGDTQ